MVVVGVLVVLLEVILDHVPDRLDELAPDFEAGCSSPRLFCLQWWFRRRLPVVVL